MNNEQHTKDSSPFPDELNHLFEINGKLDEALRKAEADLKRLDKDYRDSKRYMASYRGELDPHEMFQNELLLKQTDRTGAIAMDTHNRLAMLKDSPYFARIDYRGSESEQASAFYIGKFSFNYKNELLIFDWRAPVSGMFYDCEVGPAGYDAPMGHNQGELVLKRQFKIKNGVMEYAIETSSQVQDEVLQKELSHSSDEKMKSIISTIQKEQNQIIRNENTGTLIIQGVAGSGKTSIALHRIAFLLYRFKNKINARNVAILSPNKVFGDYISNVIPELGEEPIYQLSLCDIAEIELDKVIRFEPDRDPMEEREVSYGERERFKSKPEFVSLMNEYIANLPDKVFTPSDYTFGSFTADGRWIRNRFLAYGKYPVKQRLSMVADDIYSRFQTDNVRENELPKNREILKSLTAMLTIKNTQALYKDFYETIGAPRMFFMPGKKMLEWPDVFPFIYLRSAFEGSRASGLTKHLLIDEMQDYTPIQFAVLNLLFPCSKTILGDFGQSLNPNHSHTLADIRKLYEGAQYTELNKSYRSSYEIMSFCRQIQNTSSLDAVKRHGDEPVIMACEDMREEIWQIKKAILNFKERDHHSLGIILKTNHAAKELYDYLSPEINVSLLSPESQSFDGGISITSVQMAKGLEFDEVIVPEADHETYGSEHDCRLLYVACTRAMHRLTLLYTGTISGFLPSK